MPLERMLYRNARSDAELPVMFGQVERVKSSDRCKEEVLSSDSSRVATEMWIRKE